MASSTGWMDYLNKDNMLSMSNEVRTSFEWEAVLVKPPRGFYCPPDHLFRYRTKAVSGLEVPKSAPTWADMRGNYRVGLPGLTTITLDSVSFTLVEFEDLSFTTFLTDAMTAYNDPKTRTSLRRKDLVMDWQFFALSQDRVPLMRWSLYNCFISDFTLPLDFSGTERSPQYEVSMSLACEYYEFDTLNMENLR